MGTGRLDNRLFAASHGARRWAIVGTMKTITPSLRGLASSLLLNVGLAQAAEKLDPIARHQTKGVHALGALATTNPCAPSMFTMRSR